MRTYPEDEYDMSELKKLNAKQWMINALKMNPSYTCWGNHEDYMTNKGQWDSPIEIENVDGLWDLDDLNELANFYFQVIRDSVNCTECNTSGLNKGTKQISDDWYDFDRTGKRWCNDITQDEVDALWEHHRLRCDFKEKPTANEVNAWSRGKSLGHDAINKSICVETRAKRLGVYGLCPVCNGEGYVFTAPEAHLELQMWFLHPRKGCSRGVLLKNINEDEMPKVIEYLKEAAQRNADRFSKLT